MYSPGTFIQTMKVLRKHLAFIIIVCVIHVVSGQTTIELGGMSYTHDLSEESITITLSAPTTGWVALGFNNEDDIVGSDLIMLRIKDGQIEGQDLFVKGHGDPRKDESLGGTQDIEILHGEEKNGVTSITFKRSLRATDYTDFSLEKGAPLWIILAYSVDDDFAHHSRMRKHKKIILE